MPAKAPLVTREVSTTTVSTDSLASGQALSFAELDSNFINLRDQTIGLKGTDSTVYDIKAGDTVTFTTGTVTSDSTGIFVNTGNSTGDVTFTGRSMSGVTSINGYGDAINNLFSITATANGVGGTQINISGLGRLPSATPNGTNINNYLKNDGYGNVTWSTLSSGAASVGHYALSDPGSNSTLNLDFNNGGMQSVTFAGDVITIAAPTNMSAGYVMYLITKSSRAGSSNVYFPAYFNAYGNGGFGVANGQIVVWTILYNGTDYVVTGSGNLTNP